MQVFEKRVGDVIQIGDEVQVCILETDGETVRVGVNSPRDIAVREVDSQPAERTLVDQDAPEDMRESDGESNDSGSQGFTR